MDVSVASHLRRQLVEAPKTQTERLLRRAQVQIEFAKAFSEGNSEWLALVDESTAKLKSFKGDFSAFLGVVAEIENLLAPIGKAAKTKTIHMVAHGHIDMNWMWSWPETVASTHDTFASVLAMMDEYPELTYSQSQASVYALTEKYHPEMFAKIQQRVKEGRWEVTACQWVEGDKNLASGEALAHHLLYTRRYFLDKFGLSPEDVPVNWEPDTFGHANTIPSILAKGAVKFYYSCRTGGGFGHPRTGEERPPVFWWEGPDGARILVNRETTWYNSYCNIGENYAIAMVPALKESGLSHWLDVYGIGNHGGGPTRDEVDWFLESRDFPIWPTVKFSTSKAYFEAIEAEILGGVKVPTLKGELNYEFTGCYTSQSAIKHGNRFGENYCVEAETAAALGKRPTPLLRDAWVNVLFNQFHDILPGSGVAATRRHAQALFQETGAITGSVKREFTKTLGGRIDTLSLLPEGEQVRNFAFEAGTGSYSGISGISANSGGGRRFFPIVVYNPCAWKRTEWVQVRLYDSEFDPKKLVATDENGVHYPTLFIPGPNHFWGHHMATIAFCAVDIPPLGYRTFLIQEGELTEGALPELKAKSELEIETPFFTAKFARTSTLIDVLGKGSIGDWEYVKEQSRGMTAWALGEEVERTSLQAHRYDLYGANRNEGTAALGGGSVIAIANHDCKVPGTSSTVNVKALFQGASPRIDFTAEIDWREIGEEGGIIPGLAVECDAFAKAVVCETPFGSVSREEVSDDMPSLRYVSLDGQHGYTLLQDSKYGFRFDEQSLRMRVVRSSTDPDHAPEVNKSTLRYAVVFHDSKPKTSELTRLGAAFNHPLLVFTATFQKGDLPTTDFGAEVLTSNVVLTTVKPAEDGEGLVLRLAEYDGKDTEAKVELHPSLIAGKTKAQVVDLIERSTEGAAKLEGDVLSVKIAANSLVSVKIH